MTHEYILWIATIAYGFHMIEETVYNWHGCTVAYQPETLSMRSG